MRTRLIVILAAILWLVPASSPGYEGLQNLATSAAGSSAGVLLTGSSIGYHQLSWTKTGTVSTCQVKLEQSVDNAAWTDLIANQTCTTNGNSALTTGTVNYVRITVGTLTGGGTISVTWTGYDTLPAGALIGVNLAHEFAGADAGAKIAAAITALPVTGGTVDARGLEGAQTISANLTLGSATKPVTLLLGASTYTLSAATIILQNGSAVIGMGGMGRVAGENTTIQRTAGTTTMISATGIEGTHVRGFLLRGLFLNGGDTAGHGIVLDYVDTFKIEDVQLQDGGASNALRLLNEVWDYSVVNSSFNDWGDATNYTVDMVGLDATRQITDGHWYGVQLGEVGDSANGNPVLRANGFVAQHRFVDVKFHHTGGTMTHLVDWNGYRSDFIGSTFQGDTASSTGGMVRIKNSDNRISGGEFNDVTSGDAIHFSGSGGGVVSGVTFRGTGAPSPGSAVVAEATSAGNITVFGNEIFYLTKGYDFSTGASVKAVGPSNFTGVTTPLDSSGVGGSWTTYNAGKSAATFLSVSSSTVNPASAGQLRLAKTDTIKFRNNANGADIAISLDASDNISMPSLSLTGANSGFLGLTQGAAQTAPANSVGFQSPVTVTSAFLFTLPAAPAAGVLHATNATPSVLSSSAVVEADITLANNTTNDVSITKHGFVPIAPNVVTQFLDGTGVFSTPTASFNPMDASVVWHRDDFLHGGTVAAANNGELQWVRSNVAGTTGTAFQVSTAGRIGILRFSVTTTTAGDGGGLSPPISGSIGNVNATLPAHFRWDFKLTTNTNSRFRIGLCNSTGTVVPTDGTWLRFDTNATYGDTTFRYETRASSSSTVDAATPAVNMGWHKLLLDITVSGTMVFTLDALTPVSIATNVPTANVGPCVIMATDGTTAQSVDLDFYADYYTGLAR